MNHVTNSVFQWAETEALGQLRSQEQNLVKAATAPNDPAHEEIQVDLHLPIPVKSLDSLPEVPELNSFGLARNVKNLVNVVPLLGGLNKYMPDFSGELMPPFKGMLVTFI